MPVYLQHAGGLPLDWCIPDILRAQYMVRRSTSAYNTVDWALGVLSV